MYWRSEKEIIDDFVKVLRRIFTYVENVTNKDKEFVILPTGSMANSIFESFASINEDYPQIRVDSGGMSFIDHLNNLITTNAGGETPLGYRPLKKVIATHDFPITTILPSDLVGASIRGFVIPLANTNYMEGSEDVDIELKRVIYTTTPIPTTEIITVASGSLSRNPSNEYLKSFAPIYPFTDILNGDYLTITPRVGDSYIFGVDEDRETSCTYFENGVEINAGGSLYGRAISTAFIRIGAGIEGSILIKCSSKDDSKTARNLASTVAIYCNLLKQAQISRKQIGYYADKLQLVFGTTEEYDEWLEKGIRIKAIRQNPINYRRRSSNEIIYESTIVIDVASEWFQDFQADTLEEISVDIYGLLLEEINAEINNETVIIKNDDNDENYFITSEDEYFECPEGILVVS
jgi:hypothetical protein